MAALPAAPLRVSCGRRTTLSVTRPDAAPWRPARTWPGSVTCTTREPCRFRRAALLVKPVTVAEQPTVHARLRLRVSAMPGRGGAGGRRPRPRGSGARRPRAPEGCRPPKRRRGRVQGPRGRPRDGGSGRTRARASRRDGGASSAFDCGTSRRPSTYGARDDGPPVGTRGLDRPRADRPAAQSTGSRRGSPRTSVAERVLDRVEPLAHHLQPLAGLLRAVQILGPPGALPG